MVSLEMVLVLLCHGERGAPFEVAVLMRKEESAKGGRRARMEARSATGEEIRPCRLYKS